jgi:hypothetical protein
VLATREGRDYQIHQDTRVKISEPFEMLEYLHPNPNDLHCHLLWFLGHLVQFQDAADLVSKVSRLSNPEDLL